MTEVFTERATLGEVTTSLRAKDQPHSGAAELLSLAAIEHGGDVIAAMQRVADLYAEMCAAQSAGASVQICWPDGSTEEISML